MPPGSFTETEQDPGPNWALSRLVCDDADSTGDVPSRTATFRLSPGEHVTCVFTNTDLRATLRVSKRTVPADDGRFNFVVTDPGLQQVYSSFELGDGESSTPLTVASVYTVSEGVDPALFSTVSECHDQVTGDLLATGAAVITVTGAPSQQIDCTFTNTAQQGTFTIAKQVLPPGSSLAIFSSDDPGECANGVITEGSPRGLCGVAGDVSGDRAGSGAGRVVDRSVV